MQESIVFLVRVQCRRKGSSHSLSHLLMTFLLHILTAQKKTFPMRYHTPRFDFFSLRFFILNIYKKPISCDKKWEKITVKVLQYLQLKLP